MKKILITSATFLLSAVPLAASAAATQGSSVSPSLSACSNFVSGGFTSIVDCALGMLNAVIPVIMAITIVWVIWSSFKFASSEGEDRNGWRDMILYGIVGLFVMVSIYGLVNILSGTFGGLSNANNNLPAVQIKIQ